MDKLTRCDVLRKCVILFEAIKRVASKGGAGLEPANGAEEEFWMDSECLHILRNMIREAEATGENSGMSIAEMEKLKKELQEQRVFRNWQLDAMDGPPERLGI